VANAPGTRHEIGVAMTFEHRTYQLVLYDATTGKEIRRATVLDTYLWRIDTVAVKRPKIRETRCDYEL